MSQADFSQFEYVLTFLSSRMAPPDWLEDVDPQVKRSHGVAESRPVQPGKANDEGVKRQLVVLLGAGCSRQYGLPSFLELLRYLWEDCLREAPDDDMGLEVLRDKLDKFWQGQGPNYRTHMLKRYLRHGRVDGATCPGYVHLARLAKEGYVKAIINMNFDTLLEDAMYHCDVSYRVATSFLVQDDKRIVIYKPHGTIGRVDSEDSIEGLLRAAQEVLDAEKSLETEKDALLRIFNRALEHFKCDGKHLVQAANGKVEGSKTLARLCSLFLGLENASPGEIRPDLPVLREALESLIRAFRAPVRAKNDLILDIANSDLFSDSEEQRCAQELLTGHDVLSIGYSGVDAKIAAALRAFTSSTDPKDKKLFVVNIAPPDPRLLSVMAMRASQDLLITGSGAAFENFVGSLVKSVDRLEAGEAKGKETVEDKRQIKKEMHSSARSSSMTNAEQKALIHCLRLAQDIRLSMNIAERSRTSIEEHGYKIFSDCLELAQRAGICLNSAEKYLLHSTAFLHDLGYYRGYMRAKVAENPGWTLLEVHGRLTRKLLQDRFSDDPESSLKLMPSTYEELSTFEAMLCTLCEGHSGLVEVEPPEKTDLSIDGVKVTVRFRLLLSLFALAEDLSEGHPFVPSLDFVGPSSGRSKWSIVDPVLDLYLRQNERPLDFGFKMRWIVVDEKDGNRPATIRWLLTMAAYHIRRFDEEARKAGGWGIKLDPRWESKLLPAGGASLNHQFKPLLRRALAEMLERSLVDIRPGSSGEASALLDLISIYTMSADPKEVRVNLAEELPESDDAVHSVLDRALDRALKVGGQKQFESHGLLWQYLRRKRSGRLESSSMQERFCESFEGIIYPAWRFFARNWHDGIETLLMARACFDLGSSQFRGETLEGVRKILDERVEKPQNEAHRYSHGGCTLCTARLLYVLANARRFFPDEIPELDTIIKGILSYMLSLPEKGEIWWGFGGTPEVGRIRSADYLAWPARAVGFCISVDRELQACTGEEWLTEKCGIPREELHRLLRQRWDQLLQAGEPKPDELLSDLAEEPHSFIFGHVALACLDLKRYDKEIQDIACADVDGQVRAMARRLKRVADRLGQLSRLSQFYLWPLQLLLDSEGLGPAAVKKSPENSARSAAEYAAWLCIKCVNSPVWIKGGGDAGSWGFNVKNTQAIVTSLVEFWRYALASEEREARFEEVFSRLEPPPTPGLDNPPAGCVSCSP